MNWIISLIKDLMDKKFTGNIQINFQFGGITNINKVESIKPPSSKN